MDSQMEERQKITHFMFESCNSYSGRKNDNFFVKLADGIFEM